MHKYEEYTNTDASNNIIIVHQTIHQTYIINLYISDINLNVRSNIDNSMA